MRPHRSSSGCHPLEAQLAGDGGAVQLPVEPGQGAGAQRHLSRARAHCLKPGGVAAQHPEIGKQVVGQVDRLGALQVRVAGHRPPGVGVGELAEPSHQLADQLDRALGTLADVEGDVGRDLIVARAPRVQLAADRAGDLGDPALDRHVDVFVVGLERKAILAELEGDLVESRVQGVELAVVEHAGEEQGARVRLRLAHVLRPETPIEPDRRVQPVKERVLGLAEARHRADLRRRGARWPWRGTAPSLRGPAP